MLLQLCSVHATLRVSPAEPKPDSVVSGKKPYTAFKKKDKKGMHYLSSMLVTTALCKSVRKEVKEVGFHPVSHQQLSAAPQARKKGFLNVLR